MADMSFPSFSHDREMICAIFLYCKGFVLKLPYRFQAGTIAQFMPKNFLFEEETDKLKDREITG
ncbi:hypothetical protein J28TS4_29830 [Paenibacillus lautus]|nr:hypothetical protein J28TS4_29830 [Paenibacillus lautus]